MLIQIQSKRQKLYIDFYFYQIACILAKKILLGVCFRVANNKIFVKKFYFRCQAIDLDIG